MRTDTTKGGLRGKLEKAGCERAGPDPCVRGCDADPRMRLPRVNRRLASLLLAVTLLAGCAAKIAPPGRAGGATDGNR